MKTVFFFVVTLFLLKSNAQSLHLPVNKAYLTPVAYSEDHADIVSFTTNQASIAYLKNAGLAIYSERRFMLNDLGHHIFASAIPTSSGNFGFQFQYFGSSIYSESKLGIAYGRRLGKNVAAGLQFNYQGLNISSGYGHATAMGAEAGIIIHLSEKVNTGIQVTNIKGGKFGKDKEEEFSSVYSFGIGYDASEKFVFSFTMQKEEDRPVNVLVGMQYKFVDKLFVRAGVSTNTSSAWIGAGLFLKDLRLDLIASYHPLLGISPGILIVFELKKREK